MQTGNLKSQQEYEESESDEFLEQILSTYPIHLYLQTLMFV